MLYYEKDRKWFETSEVSFLTTSNTLKFFIALNSHPATFYGYPNPVLKKPSVYIDDKANLKFFIILATEAEYLWPFSVTKQVKVREVRRGWWDESPKNRGELTTHTQFEERGCSRVEKQKQQLLIKKKKKNKTEVCGRRQVSDESHKKNSISTSSITRLVYSAHLFVLSTSNLIARTRNDRGTL